MLKWAVNGPKQSYLPTVGENEIINGKGGASIASRCSLNSLIDTDGACGKASTASRRLKHKSSDVDSLRHKLRSQNKENQLTSTPLPFSIRGCCYSPSRKVSGFKDLSNITADDAPRSTLKRRFSQGQFLSQTPENQSNRFRRSIPANYASTLPTFDVEYSPCGLVPGPILALRGLGVGIADTYFEKPRYLSQEYQGINLRNESAESRPNVLKEAPSKLFMNEEESSLSSSKMGDTTLENMIDAILESARKERKSLKYPKQVAHRTNMSPTYTPADDPASDLHEFWDVARKQYRPGALQTSTGAAAFNEREVCSPLVAQSHKKQQAQNLDAFQLRRQRAVRRKRKTESTTMNVPQKVFVKGGSDRSAGYELRAVRPIPDANNQLRNISPDSGRNSSSDYDDSMQDSSIVAAVSGEEDKSSELNATKRRLNFSVKGLFES